MRFHKTENVTYECVYDDDTGAEYTTLYDFLTAAREVAIENYKLQERLKVCEDLLYKHLINMNSYRYDDNVLKKETKKALKDTNFLDL